MRLRRSSSAAARRRSLGALRELVVSRGGVLLARQYVNTVTKVRVECGAGHRFAMTPDHLKAGRWCSRCAREARHRRRLGELEEAVRERGGRILSAYHNASTHVRFECARRHRFRSIPRLVENGTWCRICANEARIATQQAEALERLRQCVDAYGGRVLSPWNGSKGTMLFECGLGHRFRRDPEAIRAGQWCSICRGTRRTIEQAHELARARGGSCLSRRYHNPQRPLRWRCAARHEWSVTLDTIRAGRWCPRCHGLPRGDLEQMDRLATERGGELLSTVYRDANAKLRWRCSKGHEWSAKPADVVKGSWCHACAKAKGGHPRLTLEDMRRTAAERGGECLSEVYLNNKQRLRWRCARGHEWSAFGNRVRQGSWCPECKHTVRGTLGSMEALALDRGGRCLSRSWNDHRRPLRFRCAAGHTFCLPSSAVRTGLWCPTCAEGDQSAHTRAGAAAPKKAAQSAAGRGSPTTSQARRARPSRSSGHRRTVPS
jgi:hypothetical protein